MTRPVKVLFAVVALLLVGIQAVRPDRSTPANNPALAIEASLDVPAGVRDVLVRSCYDCHSHETRWPWYSSIAPVAWLVANDVAEGRKHLNFSTWGEYPADRALRKLDAIAELVASHEMPMPIYTYLHRDAALDDATVAKLTGWVQEAKRALGGPAGAGQD